jgi:cytochrome bd-type quinol oxidase subunit 2
MVKTKKSVGGIVEGTIVFIVLAIGAMFKLAGTGLSLYVICTILAIAIIIGWIFMLVDCLNYEKEEQVVWTLLLIFLPVLGALLYLCMRYKQNR